MDENQNEEIRQKVARAQAQMDALINGFDTVLQRLSQLVSAHEFGDIVAGLDLPVQLTRDGKWQLVRG